MSLAYSKDAMTATRERYGSKPLAESLSEYLAENMHVMFSVWEEDSR